MTTAAPISVITFWKKKTRPYPRKKRTVWRSTVARDISCPVWWRS
jgi:hypothetical protein